ncbi:HdeD protein [Legionella beliardensis]|uniref:HdeD protein n=1 Tax=Legionella beliardensis TaxID=91822 RepID=A0A378HZQ2_9GAMM|nr:HdeD family acid-resistance protein [Legionella beliardensis]STX28407.1 HdeD protein [Legionella beliardensis]
MDNNTSNKLAIPASLRRHWGWLLGLGILFIVLGALALGMLVSVTLASILVIGVLLIIAGAGQLIDAFKCKGWKAILWHVLIALLYIWAGALIIYDPVLASAILTAMLAWLLIAIGFIRFVMAFTLKQNKGSFWLILAGLASIIMGVIILSSWPVSGLWVIGLLIAIELLISGWSYVFFALALR